MCQTLQKLNTRLLALVVAVLLIVCQTPAASAAESSGSCGRDLSWSFSAGRLTVTGTGDMTDYSQSNLPPWYEFRDQILFLTLPEGLTSVGNMAFYDCVNLTAISIPSTVTDIGQLAFCQCRSVTILSLNTGLKSIGRSAFELCENLRDLRLPNTLTSLGNEAFYRCTALQYVTIPASVTHLGSGAFAYCDSLIGAQIEAPLDTVPSWCFYGCENLVSISLPEQTTGTEDNAFSGCNKLDTVYYSGSEENAEALKAAIGADVEQFPLYGNVTADPPTQSGTTTEAEVNEEGSVVVDRTTVTVTDDATISVTTTEDDSSASVEVDATVHTPEGWDELLQAVEDAREILNQKSDQGVSVAGTIDVNGYVVGGNEVPRELLEQLSGQNVSLTIQTESGAKFAVDGSAIADQDVVGGLGLNYTLAQQFGITYDALGDAAVYLLRFEASSAVNAEVMLRLPLDCARSVASLYQMDEKEPELLQSVVVDPDGYAHFYLGSVDKDTEYLIGVDVQGIDSGSVIVPEELHEEYGITDLSSPIEYVITGRTSSWGMDAGQVTWIMIGVMLGCVVIIGAVMFALNKRKLKMGYIPELDDEE